MQGHVAVVAQLAQWDPQPVGLADAHDRAGVEVSQFAGPHAGAGEQFHDEAVAGVGGSPGGGHERGGVLVARGTWATGRGEAGCRRR
jgi:hypothetical protein